MTGDPPLLRGAVHVTVMDEEEVASSEVTFGGEGGTREKRICTEIKETMNKVY